MWVHDNFDCSLPCSELQSSSSQWPGIQGLSAEAPAFQPYVTRHVFQWWSKVTPLRDCCGIKPPWGWPLNVWVIEALPAFPIKMCETMSREHSEGIFSSCVLAWNYGTMEGGFISPPLALVPHLLTFCGLSCHWLPTNWHIITSPQSLPPTPSECWMTCCNRVAVQQILQTHSWAKLGEFHKRWS